MNVGEKLREWLTLPTYEIPRYRCQECGESATEAAESCPSCGGELEVNEDVPPLEYWGPLH